MIVKTLRPYTEAAIYMAHSGAAKMDAQGYDYQKSKTLVGTATIITPYGKRYRTHVPRQSGDMPPACNCPQGQDELICKHIVWLQDQLDYEADIERREKEEEERDRLMFENGWSPF